jgi:hypothetical protein
MADIYQRPVPWVCHSVCSVYYWFIEYSTAEVQLHWENGNVGAHSELQIRYIPPGSIVVPGLSGSFRYTDGTDVF